MEISHVIRGEEWLTSTPKHLILYKALDFAPPLYAHLPLILNPAGKKLSKREGSISIQSFKDQGIAPEALLNFVAQLGWNPSGEEESAEATEKKGPVPKYSKNLLTLEKMAELFDMENISESNGKMDLKKLYFFNEQVISKELSILSPTSGIEQADVKELISKYRSQFVQALPECKEEIESSGDRKISKILLAVRGRLKSFNDLKGFKFFFAAPDSFDLQALEKMDLQKKKNVAKDILELWKETPFADFNGTNIHKMLSEYIFAKKDSVKNEEVFHLVRLALTGKTSGVSVGDICDVIGKKEAVSRLEIWMNKL
eukprot:TRINITY_DN7117_c0_g1_i4.p1 TRINITY_DN7117_c0_g1~~TRINITY_DN7117_c0_g1_i4.p1  ORF type:complete len:314 (-),score=98.37 TRINITY_DN7117_c0_g1_i4:29-970(-)